MQTTAVDWDDKSKQQILSCHFRMLDVARVSSTNFIQDFLCISLSENAMQTTAVDWDDTMQTTAIDWDDKHKQQILLRHFRMPDIARVSLTNYIQDFACVSLSENAMQTSAIDWDDTMQCKQ